jgi:hypothetical protein
MCCTRDTAVSGGSPTLASQLLARARETLGNPVPGKICTPVRIRFTSDTASRADSTAVDASAASV